MGNKLKISRGYPNLPSIPKKDGPYKEIHAGEIKTLRDELFAYEHTNETLKREISLLEFKLKLSSEGLKDSEKYKHFIATVNSLGIGAENKKVNLEPIQRLAKLDSIQETMNLSRENIEGSKSNV